MPPPPPSGGDGGCEFVAVIDADDSAGGDDGEGTGRMNSNRDIVMASSPTDVVVESRS